MIWLAWRQFRTQAFVALALLAGFAALVVVTGSHLHNVYSSLGGVHCAGRNDCTALGSHDKTLAELLGPALLAIPALLGMFWGAPLVAREFESGTYRLAWTQSVTRRRWLSVRVALVGLTTLAVAGLASWLVSWWFAPLDAVNMNRIDPSVLSARGIVAIGYAGFAFALGVAAGALIRRTLPAMAATLIGFLAARVAITLLRPHLLPAKQALYPVSVGQGVGFVSSPSGLTVAANTPTIPNAWTISDALVDRAHHPLGSAQLHALLVRACPTLESTSSRNPAGGKGLESLGLTCQQALAHHIQLLVAYQPANHYWTLEVLETAIFLAAAVALIATTVWRIGRRAANKLSVGESRERAAHPSPSEATPDISVQVGPPDDGVKGTPLARIQASPTRRWGRNRPT